MTYDFDRFLDNFFSSPICSDEHFLLEKDRWCALVQRAATGMDLFELSGFGKEREAPTAFHRLKNWPDGVPSDLRKICGELLRNQETGDIN
jgi:hypothetical protein